MSKKVLVAKSKDDLFIKGIYEKKSKDGVSLSEKEMKEVYDIIQRKWKRSAGTLDCKHCRRAAVRTITSYYEKFFVGKKEEKEEEKVKREPIQRTMKGNPKKEAADQKAKEEAEKKKAEEDRIAKEKADKKKKEEEEAADQKAKEEATKKKAEEEKKKGEEFKVPTIEQILEKPAEALEGCLQELSKDNKIAVAKVVGLGFDKRTGDDKIINGVINKVAKLKEEKK